MIMEKAQWQEQEVAGQEAERDEGWCPTCSLLLIQYKALAHKMVLPLIYSKSSHLN